VASRPSILILSKDDASFEGLRMCLSDPGMTTSAHSVEQALRVMEGRDTPVIVMEMEAGGDLEGLARRAYQLDADSQLLILGSEAQLSAAGRWQGMGSVDLYSQPVDPEVLRNASDRAVEVYALRRQLKRWQAGPASGDGHALLGSSPVTRAFS
jgi:DNA-binding NtrC family response regulator